MPSTRKLALLATIALAALAQTAPTPSTALHLAANGHCDRALPSLKRALITVTDKPQRKQLGLALTRCAMDLNAFDEAAAALRTLHRENTTDPDVLLLEVRTYSEMSLSASRTLMRTAPGSAQVHELNAEALESQGRWDDAEKEYRMMLARFPGYPGIHFKLGRLLLSQPGGETHVDQAKPEFEAELKENPDNAQAECVLGEIARQQSQWDEAAKRFRRALAIDASFFDALLGLGRTLLANDHPADAIAPLERAVRAQPQTPVAHLHLANAYSRAGRSADAAREQQAIQQIQAHFESMKAALDGVKQDK